MYISIYQIYYYGFFSKEFSLHTNLWSLISPCISRFAGYVHAGLPIIKPWLLFIFFVIKCVMYWYKFLQTIESHFVLQGLLRCNVIMFNRILWWSCKMLRNKLTTSNETNFALVRMWIFSILFKNLEDIIALF